MDGAEVGVLEEADEVSLGRLLEGEDASISTVDGWTACNDTPFCTAAGSNWYAK